MEINEYQKIVNSKNKNLNNPYESFYSFLSGGILLSTLQIFIILFNKIGFENGITNSIISMLLILITILITGLGKFDNYIRKYRFGLIIPTTGFAHSVICCLLDYKYEGYITGLGSNAFKLAGSVIIYGILSAFICTVIKVVIYG